MLIVGYKGNKQVFLKSNRMDVIEAFVSRFNRWEYLSTRRLYDWG